MRTATTPVAEATCRILVLIALFALTVSRGASAQPAHVEWAKFVENGQTYLALNAYEGSEDVPRVRASVSAAAFSAAVSAERGGSPSAVAAPPPSTPVYGLVVEFPIRDVPTGPDVAAFLSVLEQLDSAAAVQSTWKPETSEEWTNLLRVLTHRKEIWLHGRVINSREVVADLKNVYELRGHPTRENPIFPHLTRGVLAVSDIDGKPLTSLKADFAARATQTPFHKLLTFENLGSRPLKVYTETEKFSPIRLSGTAITLGPGERTTRLISVEPSVFSMGKQESRALVRFASGGIDAEAFDIHAVHAGWGNVISGTLASATTSLFGAWGAGAILPVAAAFGGLLLVFVYFGVMRNAVGVAAPAIDPNPFRQTRGGTRSLQPAPGALRKLAKAWVQFAALTQDILLRFVYAVVEMVGKLAASVVEVARRGPDWIRRATIGHIARVRPRAASLGDEARSRALPLLDDARLRVTSRISGSISIMTSRSDDARMRMTSRARAAGVQLISLAQKSGQFLASRLERAVALVLLNARAVSRGLLHGAQWIGRHGSWLVATLPNTGSRFVEGTSRTATAMSRLVLRHVVALTAAARERVLMARESAPGRTAALRETAAEILAALREAVAARVAVAWRMIRRFAAASARAAGGLIAAVGSNVRDVFRFAMRIGRDFSSSITRISRDLSSSIPRIGRDSESSIRRIGHGFAAAMWTKASEFAARLHALRPIRAASTGQGGAHESLRRQIFVVSDRGIAPVEDVSRSSAPFYEPLRRYAASARESAGRLAAALKQELAPSIPHGDGILLDRVPRRAGNPMQSIIDRVSRLVRNMYLYREWTVATIPSIDGSECIERMRRLIDEMEQGSQREAQRSLRKEAKRLARRLECHLERELVPRTTTNFQVLWALRLLHKILEHPPKNPSVAIKNWLNGAERVVRSQGRDGIGPTVPEFLSYL